MKLIVNQNTKEIASYFEDVNYIEENGKYYLYEKKTVGGIVSNYLVISGDLIHKNFIIFDYVENDFISKYGEENFKDNKFEIDIDNGKIKEKK